MKNEKYIKYGLTGAAIVAFGILFFFLVYRIDMFSGIIRTIMDILRPFLVGAVIAYIVTPLARKINALFRGKRPGLSNVLALIAILLIVILIALLIVPQLVTSIVGIVKALPGQLASAQAGIDGLLSGFTEAHPEYAESIENTLREIGQTVSTFINRYFGTADDVINTLKPILIGSTSTVSSAIGLILDLFIGLIVTLYFLSKRAQLAAQGVLIVRGLFKDSWADWILHEVRYADRMFNGFFIGKLLDSAIVGAICLLGCLVMRFESPLLIAVIVGVTNIIPFFGPFIGAIPCALLLLLINPIHALMFLVFVMVLQQIDGNIIGPKILGDSTGLSALWVMFGILLFGGLWGIVGMLVGVPLMAVIYDIVRQLTFRGVRGRGHEAMIEEYHEQFHSGKKK